MKLGIFLRALAFEKRGAIIKMRKNIGFVYSHSSITINEIANFPEGNSLCINFSKSILNE